MCPTGVSMLVLPSAVLIADAVVESAAVIAWAMISVIEYAVTCAVRLRLLPVDGSQALIRAASPGYSSSGVHQPKFSVPLARGPRFLANRDEAAHLSHAATVGFHP